MLLNDTEERTMRRHEQIRDRSRRIAPLQVSIPSILDETKPPRAFLDRVEFGVAVAMVFFSPMNFLRLPFFYFTLSDGLACISLVLLLLRGRLTFAPIGRASTFVWMSGLMLMLGMLLISSLLHFDPLRGLVYVMQYFFAYGIILLVVGGRPQQELHLFAKIYVISVLLMCVHGAYLINIDGQRNTSFVSGSGRLTGFVERENECAALIALTTPLLMLLVAARQWPKIALLGVALMGYGVMLTGSNTGLGSFALVVALYAFVITDWKILVPIGASVMGLVVLIDQFGRDYLPPAFQRRVLGALENGDISEAGSFDHRVDLIREAIGLTGKTAVFGLGADQYAIQSFVGQPVHNLYLLLWTEGGFMCMIGFIVMFAGGFGPALAAWNKPNGRVYAACTFCMVGLFVGAVNAFPSVYGRFWTVPLALTMAMSYAASRRTGYENGFLVYGLKSGPSSTATSG
jgi:O-antigen ligase